MKTNVTLIGMPGAGKSTVGILLAKNMKLSFIDTDILIQINNQKTLQEILNESDHLHLRALEEIEILKINIDHHVIATGGSVPYSEKSMSHLAKRSIIVHLNATYNTIERRIHNFETRGIAKAKDQSFTDLFNERQALYKKYADLTIDTDTLTQDEVTTAVEEKLLKVRDANYIK